MERIEPADQTDPERAFKTNSIAAVVMTFATAAVLALLRPELFLVFISYLGMSVYSLSLARTHGFFVKPYPVKQQNFAAYVSFSTLSFFGTLIAAPQLIELHGAVIYGLVFIVMAGLVLHAIAKSL